MSMWRARWRREREVLMLGDSALDQPCARKMDLIARQWSGKHRRAARGSGLVTLL
jgi:hypothetical protein